MKRITACFLAALMMCAACACAAAEDAIMATLAGLEWSFSSGVGGWSTDLRILEDGSFSGEYHDSEMGETGDGYPDGTVYCCSFTGRMSTVGQADGNSWRIRVDELRTDGSQAEEAIDGGIRFVKTEPYGISEGDVMILYAPGTPLEALSEEMRFWTHAQDMDPVPDALDSWFLTSEKNESGFASFRPEPLAYLPNPWQDLTAEQLSAVSGITFGVPEGAEDVIWRWMKDTGLAEMQFTLDGDEYCARIQPAALKEGELPDISGIYIAWETEEDVTVHHCRGVLSQAQFGSSDWVQRCLWYDAAPGLICSLSVSTEDPGGLDLTAVAEQVYTPVQGDV